MDEKVKRSLNKSLFRLRLVYLILPMLLLLTASTCKNRYRQPAVSDQELNQYKEPLVNVNRQLVEKDRILIEKYAERRNWDMQGSETGMYYLIDSTGSGDVVQDGDLVTITYNLSLLDGTLCYSTDSLGAESFVVGHEDVESGLDEGVRLMRKGDKAKLIIPPHLAHGLLGDQDKIPPRSIILIELEMVDIRRY